LHIARAWAFFGGCIYSTPIFELAPTLGSVESQFLMEIGDFTFFQIIFFLNLEYTCTFISTVGIFVS
jgi:hypothetical protein